MITLRVYPGVDQKYWKKVFPQWNCLLWSWFLMHFGSGSLTKHSALLRSFCRSSSIWKGTGMLQFQKSSTHPCTKTLQREYLAFRHKFNNLERSSLFRFNPPHFHYGICGSPKSARPRETQKQRNLYHN